MTASKEAPTIGELLVRVAASYPERDAVVLPDQRVTFLELAGRVTSRSKSLLGCGIAFGDHVGIYCQNSLAFVEAFFAIASIGGVAVPISPRFAPEEVAFVVEHSDVVALMASPYGWESDAGPVDLLQAAFPGLQDQDPLAIDVPGAPRLRVVALFDGPSMSGACDPIAFEALGRPIPSDAVTQQRAQVSPTDVAAIMYTSGTTARPKGAIHTHASLVRPSMARFEEGLKRAEEERGWCPTPLCHIGALAVLLGTLGHGDTFVSMARVDAGIALEQLANERVTIAWPQFPAIIHAMAEHPRRTDRPLTSVRQAIVVLDPAGIQAAELLFPNASIISGFGMTEVGGVAFGAASDPRELRVTSVGRPLADVEIITIDSETGGVLGAGELGELLIRGYPLFSGYYKDDHATRAAIDGDGWFHTGDLGVVNANGSIVFRGRLKDILKVGGENVAAMEIETVLLAHPAIRTAAVVGAPDRRLDEIPFAFVELEPGGELSADAVSSYCAEHLARFKVPRHVRFVEPDSWPMSGTKIDKRPLRAEVEREFTRAGV
jgi:fatty-acyl-CoA synthase/long-chain acyl-CoA synthetase